MIRDDETTATYRELRGPAGKLYAEYDPLRHLLRIKRGRRTVVFDLADVEPHINEKGQFRSAFSHKQGG